MYDVRYVVMFLRVWQVHVARSSHGVSKLTYYYQPLISLLKCVNGFSAICSHDMYTAKPPTASMVHSDEYQHL